MCVSYIFFSPLTLSQTLTLLPFILNSNSKMKSISPIFILL